MTACNVYVYGTLQEPSVVRVIVGRSLVGAAAVLQGHARFRVSGRVYPAIVEQPGRSVSGLLYTGVSSNELARLDEYEGPLYERKEVSVSLSGTPETAFTYVLCAQHRHLLSQEPWELEQFQREHLATYLAHITETESAP